MLSLYEILVDNFAGGGGASTGIELALGRLVDIAINHDPDAILMHKTNHPTDYPDKFIARLWDCSAPTNIIATADTLEELRAKIPDCMVKLDRHPKDDPCIVEVWI